MPHPNAVANSPLDLIGNTPVVRLNRIPPADGAEVWAKLEFTNLGGSVKDRICLSMIEGAERSGKLRRVTWWSSRPAATPASGSPWCARSKGYRLILTMPDTMSEERRSLLLAYGAELELTPDSKGMHAAVARAEEIARTEPRAFLPQQFRNPANPDAHRRTTAREILEQFPRLDAFVAGVGTGGTITGVGDVLHRERPGCKVVAVEPATSAVLSGGAPGFHKIQGIGAGSSPRTSTSAPTTAWPRSATSSRGVCPPPGARGGPCWSASPRVRTARRRSRSRASWDPVTSS